MAFAEVFFDSEFKKCIVDDGAVQPVFAQRIDDIEDVCHLSWVNDAEAVKIPVYGITDFFDPPVHVFAEANLAPFKLFCAFCHSYLKSNKVVKGLYCRYRLRHFEVIE